MRRGLGQQSLAPGHLFCLRGAFCFDKLGAVHKAMMRMMRRMLLKKGDAMTQDDRDLLAAYDTPVDFTDVSALAPLATVSARVISLLRRRLLCVKDRPTVPVIRSMPLS